MINLIFKALADPTRRQILRLLRERGMTASELAEHIKISQPTLSHHFAVLKKVELVRFRRDGPFIRYTFNSVPLKDAMAWLTEVLAEPGE